MPFPRWITAILALVAVALVPWTLWLTFSLPSKHVTHHYDLAWVGFDVALAAMLVCDAWFDVVTSTSGERLEAILQAGLAELPLAALCALVAYDVDRAHASVERLRRQ